MDHFPWTKLTKLHLVPFDYFDRQVYIGLFKKISLNDKSHCRENVNGNLSFTCNNGCANVSRSCDVNLVSDNANAPAESACFSDSDKLITICARLFSALLHSETRLQLYKMNLPVESS